MGINMVARLILLTVSALARPADVTFNCTSGPLVVPNLIACNNSARRRLTNENIQIIFVHIPKAGGTSCEMVMGEYVDDRWGTNATRLLVVRPSTLDAYMRRSVEKRLTVRMLGSKASVGALDLDPRTRLMATCVRDPVERIISHFRYVKDTHLNTACTTAGLDTRLVVDMRRWYDKLRDQPPVDLSNFEVRLLVTRLEAPELSKSSDGPYYFNDRECRSSRPLPAVNATHLQHAIRRLSQMTLLATVDDLAGDMHAWRVALGLKLPSARPSEAPRICGNKQHVKCGNAAGARSLLVREDPALLAMIEADNSFSMELWRHAQQLITIQRAAALVKFGWHAHAATNVRM